MKSFTDLEQSKKLTEILPIESADMKILPFNEREYRIVPVNDIAVCNKEDEIYAWSLAALINVLPKDWWGHTDHYFLEISKMGDASTPNKVRYFRFNKGIVDVSNDGRITHISHSADNLVDACVNMIITLHTHKLLSNK